MSFDIVSAAVQQYAEAFTTPESEVLQALNTYTLQHVHQPQMLSGSLQGQLLSLISKMLQPQTILEIGTYTGYSAICLAQGLRAGGHLHSIDKDAITQGLAKKYIEQAGLSDKVSLHCGDAKDIIPTLNLTFDLVFIDADKRGYSQYYEAVMANMNTGGVILADNVLFSGEVLQPENERSKYAEALHQFNQQVKADERVEQLLLPIRDGIMIIRKK